MARVNFSGVNAAITVLADNEQWLADHQDQTVHASDAGRTNEATTVLIGDGIPVVPQ